MNEITRKPAHHSVAELASARQHQKTGRPSWSARWRVPNSADVRRAGIPRFGVVCLKKLTTPKKSRWRAKNKKTPKKHKNTPKKRKNTPQKHKNTPKRRKKHPKKFFRAYARKKTPLFQKLIDFAGTPRPPATPGIPALGGVIYSTQHARSSHGKI